MFCKKSKKPSSKVRAQYSKQVREYLEKYSFEIVQKIYSGVLGTHELNTEQVELVLGEDYPIAPWLNERDIIGHFVAIMEEAGYEFESNENGGIAFKNNELYSAIVKNYLNFSGYGIMERLIDYCDMTGGKMTYFQVQHVLGMHYPRAPYANKADMQACIILFLKELGVPCKFDTNYVYFP